MEPTPDRLVEQIRRCVEILGDLPAAPRFLSRLREGGGLTMDENAYSHFCVYFAAYDPEVGQVFLGHHKKSGLWLFNGGHIDQGETPQEALLREIREEWGFPVDVGGIEQPRLLTITEIDNRAVQTCTRHFDIWYFVAIRKTAFTPHQASLADEFHRTAWLSPEQARQVVEDSNTLEAITILESLFRN